MALCIALEIGHTSGVRTRTTPEGYTHDWELFIRGENNADIHHYIEKVVFLLHDTFRNPKRVLKEPPFTVKESGYAGFLIPIEVYLKNKDEPKKFKIVYDLQLQQTGPLNNCIRHEEIFHNPSDDFRKKLLKGGAFVPPIRDGSLEKNDTKTSTMVGKPKLNGSENKKHRITESKTSNSFHDSFHDLFGPPIKTTPVKISPDSKKTSQSDKNLVPKPLAVTEKSDKVDKTIKLKESPHKDSRKDKIDEKKEKKVRDSSKDQLRSKEKSKRPPSPGNRSHSSPGSKRPASPVTTKKSLSPSSRKRSLSPKPKEREAKRITLEKEKDSKEKEKDSKEKEKVKNNSRSDLDSSKSEKKKEKKKHKDDRDKEKKDKYKESEKTNVKDVAKIIEKKPEKTDKAEKSDKEKLQEYKSKDGRKSPKPGKENDKVKDDRAIKEKSEKSDKSEKIKDGRYDKDRPKHKHKKREKKDKRDSKDREKKEKRDRSKDENEKQNNTASVGNPLSSLLTEVPESSDSAPSVDDDSLPESKSMLNIKKGTEHAVVSTVSAETVKPLSPSIVEIKKDKSDRSRKDKSKGNRSEERERKRKKSKEDDEISTKREKRDQSSSPPLEPVSSSQSPVAMDIDSIHHSEKETKKDFRKEKDSHVVNMADNVLNDKDTDPEQVAPDSTNSTDAELNEPPVFSEDYVSQLKDLQQKIMTLQDNDELQRVVQVIAETGQYEITKKTFDFDLCALDRRTVQRLQQFFSAS